MIVGDWNIRILTPQWVAYNLFEGQEIQVEALLRPGVQRLRYNIDNIVILPGDDRLIIGARATDDEVLQRAEQTARKVLEILPHTPIRACGVNFGFVEEVPGATLISLFELSDLGRLSDFECRALGTEIIRNLKIEEGTLKLKHSFSDGKVSINLNFHYEATSPEEARAQLDGRALSCRELAYRLLSEVYELVLDEGD